MQLSLHTQALEHRAHIFGIFSLLKATLKPPRFLALLFFPLAAVLAVPSPAQAQTIGNMLFLSTAETQAISRQDINNAWSAFEAQANDSDLTPIDGRSLLSDTAALPITPDTRLIVVVTGYNTINPGPMDELQNALENNPNLAVVIFSESCSTPGSVGGFSQNCWQSQQNLQQFIATVNVIQPQPPAWPIITLGTGYASAYTAPLNMKSLYASTFSDAGLTTLAAGNYTPLINVPLNFALYTQRALPTSPPAIITDPVVGLFIPQTASNHGQGACLFLTADAREFTDNHRDQYAPIALAFTTAALDPNGACAQPVAEVPDLWVGLSELETLTTGTPASITLTVGNTNLPGVTASADGQVDVTLPAGLTLSGALPAGCTANATGFTCTLPPLKPSDPPAAFTFDVVAPSPIAVPVTLSAVVSKVTGEVNLSNNEAVLEDIVTADNGPDLSVTLSGETQLSTNVPSLVTLTVKNGNEPGIAGSTDGLVEVVLPDNLQLHGDLPGECTPTATGFTCPVPPLEIGTESGPIEFYVVAPAPILASTSISAEVTVPLDVDLSNNIDTLHNITTIDSPDLLVALSGPSNLPIGSATTMTVTGSNSSKPGVGPSPSGSQIQVTLPTGLNLVSPPPGCTANAANTGFTCPVGVLAPGSSTAPLAFQVIAPAAITNVPIEAEITWSTRLVDVLGSYKTQKNVSAAAVIATPVPTLTELALALLALIVAGGAAMRLRRKG